MTKYAWFCIPVLWPGNNRDIFHSGGFGDRTIGCRVIVAAALLGPNSLWCNKRIYQERARSFRCSIWMQIKGLILSGRPWKNQPPTNTFGEKKKRGLCGIAGLIDLTTATMEKQGLNRQSRYIHSVTINWYIDDSQKHSESTIEMFNHHSRSREQGLKLPSIFAHQLSWRLV